MRVFSIAIIWVSSLPCLVAQNLGSPYTILYTGRLLGYARHPNSQAFKRAPGDQNLAAEEYVQLFDDLTKSRPSPTVIRLGMGDNFAPDVFARTFDMKGAGLDTKNRCHSAPSIRKSKDRFYYNGTAWVCDDPTDKQEKEAAGSGLTKIDHDNLAQFLVDAKYDAIVPGKHDFYFGPERLRDLARLLEGDGTHPVHMLAANLYIATTKAPTFENAYPRTPERLATHRYDIEFHGISLDLPDVVFPYKQQFVMKNARKVTRGGELVASSELRSLTRKDVVYNWQVSQAYICREAGSMTAGKPEDVGLPGEKGGICYRLIPAEEACLKDTRPAHLAGTCSGIYPPMGIFKQETDTSHPSPDATYLFEKPEGHLSAGLNHMFCVKLAGSKSEKWTCQPFAVQMPFFSYELPETKATAAQLAARLEKRESCAFQSPEGSLEGPRPCAVIKTSGGKVAVFGVVDPDLLSNVGLLNYGWLNKNHRNDTVASVAAADFTLKQVLELCNVTEECRQAPKVLMAQMPYGKAAQLITQLGDMFDVVLSQADQGHSTGMRDITIRPSPSPWTKTGQDCGKDLLPQFVITPPEPFSYDPDPTVMKPIPAFTPVVSLATITKKTGECSLHSEVKFGAPLTAKPEQSKIGETPAADPPGTTATTTLSFASHAALGAMDAIRTPDPYDTTAPAPSDWIRDVTLLAMQRTLHTDMAFLQKRDFFAADHLGLETVSYAELQNQIGRVIWKGDFAIPLHVKGATLKKLLKQSKKFDDLDQDALSTDQEKSRALLTLGIWRDPKDSDSYYVNGTKLDETQFYSVAASEYLALGDTGYADLQTPDVPPSTRIEDFKTLQPIDGLVCNLIRKVDPFKSIPCDSQKLLSTYFDAALQKPLDNTPGYDAKTHYTTLPKQFVPLYVPPNGGAEAKVQQRHFFSLNLESLDVSYGGTYINHVVAAGRFTGVSAPGITTTGSNALGTDHALRGIYDYRVGTYYLLSDSTFSKSSTSTSVIPTIAKNMWGVESGGTLRFSPTRPAWPSLQYSTRFEGQLTDPSPIAAGPSSVPPYLPTPQISTLYGRLGLRAEFKDTYVEFGAEQVDSRNVLLSYEFQNGAAGSLFCSPKAMLGLGCGTDPNLDPMKNNTAIKNAPLPSTAPIVHTTDYLTGGTYLKFNIKFPLWSKKDTAGADHSMYFILTNKGDLYFNSRNDTTVQTRYLDTFTPSFTIPIYGNITLTPKVDVIFYENKVAHAHYRSLQPALAVSYSFKWREGMRFPRALGYGAITQTPPPAPPLK